MATYATEIQWGGSNAPWNSNGTLVIEIQNNQSIVPVTGAPAPGTTVNWSSANGNASITFNGGGFTGQLQVPGQGGVEYQGTLQS
jgi:hypothetical protein